MKKDSFRAAAILLLAVLLCLSPPVKAEEAPLPRFAFYWEENGVWRELGGAAVFAVGQSREIRCQYLPAQGDPIPLSFTSDGNPAISVVGNLVRGVKPGRAALVTTYAGSQATLAVLVSEHAGDAESLQSERLPIDRELGIVTVSGRDTLLSTLEQSFQFYGTLRFLDQNGTEITTGRAGTGCVVQLLNSWGVVDQLTVLVPCDLDGNGVVNRADANRLTEAILGLAPLNSIQKTAADCNGDGVADSTDLYLVALYMLDPQYVYQK